MIELQWLERRITRKMIVGNGLNEIEVPDMERVLQYRIKISDFEEILVGGEPRYLDTSKWSDWQDVPTVTED